MKRVNHFFIVVIMVLFSCAVMAAGPIDINTATAEELQALNGIGEAKAAAIIQYRDQHGPFESVDDLLEVKGIGKKTLEKNRENLSVGKTAMEKAMTAPSSATTSEGATMNPSSMEEEATSQ